MKTLGVITSVCALVVAVAALTVALTHAGPRGLSGPHGPPGMNAVTAHLGVCELSLPIWVSDISVYTPGQSGYPEYMITTPDVINGVPSCPAGTFVSIVPSSQGTDNG